VSDSPVIPERFQKKIDEHLVFNFADSGAWPLVLGIFGRPGDGKSFQARKHLVNRGVLAVSINAADLESDRAGQPGKLVLARYEDAGHRASEGTPAALIVDDFDTTVGEWEHSTSTVNHQQVLAQLMHLADSPTQAADKSLRRVPVFVTGNDLSKVYPPLRRPGRMHPFFWLPTEHERQEIVQQVIASILTPSETAELLAQIPEAPIAFFSDLLVSMQAISARSEIPKYAENLKALVRNPESSRRELEDHVRRHKPAVNEVVQEALTLWHERTIATQSHLDE
jgi:SpoVK/Ycf46/Vps4 family AAA+-type ATPase